MRYALDNGAWSAHLQGKTFDEKAFLSALEAVDDPDWAVVPDIVAGGESSYYFSLEWIARIKPVPCPLLFAVQDGMTAELIEPHVTSGEVAGVFVGGSTEWKLASLEMWGELKAATGCYLHVGRVNTLQRIKMCHLVKADSFDGTSVSRFSKNIYHLDRGRRQRTLF
jgi:hypothetical protein